ncbi:MAG: hypothetical protein TUN42_05730 [Dehalogenimonas sp.]
MHRIVPFAISSLLVFALITACSGQDKSPSTTEIETITTTTIQVTNPPTKSPVIVFGELVGPGETYTWHNSLGNWKPATAVIDGVVKTLDSTCMDGNTFITTNPMTGQVQLNFTWNPEGARISEAVTSRLIGKRLGMFKGDQTLTGIDGLPLAPVINAVITTAGVIAGLSDVEAQQLCSQINAGR